MTREPMTPPPPRARPGGNGGAKAALVGGGVVAVLIIICSILLAVATEGPSALGPFVFALASPFIALIVMGLFACLALVLALVADSRRYVIHSLVWIVIGVVVVIGYLGLVLRG